MSAKIAAVLADHVRGDWSDRTYSCQGCRLRVEAQVEARWPDATDDAERQALRSELNQASKPGWSLADYNAHVAEQIAIALFTQPTPEATP